jgi:hypothetical protein
MPTVPEEGKLLGDALATVKMQVQQMKHNLVLLFSSVFSAGPLMSHEQI